MLVYIFVVCEFTNLLVLIYSFGTKRVNLVEHFSIGTRLKLFYLNYCVTGECKNDMIANRKFY